jgi:hypothetical protein
MHSNIWYLFQPIEHPPMEDTDIVVKVNFGLAILLVGEVGEEAKIAEGCGGKTFA